MKKIIVLFSLSLAGYSSIAQDHKPEFLDGYVLRNTDTIKCKVHYSFKHPNVSKNVTVSIEGDQMSFAAGSIMKGFGVYSDSASHHYGYVASSNLVGKRTIVTDLYLRKLVAGPVSLYVSHMHHTTTTRKSTDSPIDPVKRTTSEETNYYISKNDPSKPVLATAVPISYYRKKDLEKYISDNEPLYENAPKSPTEKELIQILEEYNNWFLTKKNKL